MVLCWYNSVCILNGSPHYHLFFPMYLRTQSDDSSLMTALSLSLSHFISFHFPLSRKRYISHRMQLKLIQLSWVRRATSKTLMLKKDVVHFRPYTCAEAEDGHLLPKASGNEQQSEAPDKVHSSCPCEPEVLSHWCFLFLSQGKP